MRRSLPVAIPVCAAIVAGVLPVAAQGDHRPGHPGGGAADLTISAAPNPTVFRGATVISGRLRGANNGGKSVILRQDAYPYGSGVRDVATATTNARGEYTFTRKPFRNTAYQAVVGTTLSAKVLVNVRIRIGLRVSDSTPAVGQFVRFRGVACPAHDGRVVRIQRQTTPAAWVTVARARLRDAGKCSAYSRRLRIRRDGTYRVWTDDADHARGFSPNRLITTH